MSQPSPLSFQHRVLDSIASVSAGAWNSLLTDDDVPTLRHEWIFALEASQSACEETGWKPHHFTLWQDERLVAAAPAYLKFHSMGEYVYDFSWAQAAQSLGIPYYPKLLVAVPLSPMTARRFLIHPDFDETSVRALLVQNILDAGKKHASSAHIIFPRENERKHLETLGFSGRSGMQYHWKNPGYSTYDDFLSRFDSKRRHQLRRERNAAQEQGITIETLPGRELTAEHSQWAYRFYENTCEKNGWGSVQLNADFFRRVFETLPHHLEMVLAKREGKIVAGAFNLLSPTRRFGRYWGCIEEWPFLHFHVCLYHSIDACIRDSRKVFEPGAGGEHKIPRGFEPTEIHSAHWIFHPRLDSAIRAFVKNEQEQLRPYFEQSVKVVGMRPWEK